MLCGVLMLAILFMRALRPATPHNEGRRIISEIDGLVGQKNFQLR